MSAGARAHLRAERRVVAVRARRSGSPAPTASRPVRPRSRSTGPTAPARRGGWRRWPARLPPASCRCRARPTSSTRLPRPWKRVVERGAQLVELEPAADEDAGGQPIEAVRLDGALRGRRCRPRPGGAMAASSRLDVGRAGRAILRAPWRGAPAPAPRVGGARRGCASSARRVRCEVLRDDRHRVLAEERRTAGQHLVEHRPERVQVAARLALRAGGQLRGHVGEGADDHPLDGEPAWGPDPTASPKSPSFAVPSAVSQMLAGLMSRWTMPWLVRVVERRRRPAGRCSAPGRSEGGGRARSTAGRPRRRPACAG